MIFASLHRVLLSFRPAGYWAIYGFGIANIGYWAIYGFGIVCIVILLFYVNVIENFCQFLYGTVIKVYYYYIETKTFNY